MAFLEDYADLLRAPLFRTEESGNHPVRIASISDFPSYGYLPTPSRRVLLGERYHEARRYRLQPHDVLVTIVGTVGRVAVVADHLSEDWVPATNIVILRPREPTVGIAAALYLFFRSDSGRRAFDGLVHGKSIRLVSKKALAKIPIPTLTVKILKESGELFRAEIDLYERYLRAQKEMVSRIGDLF
ncbi:MAG: hypothetical protein ACLFPV_00390 [Spirochaetaceae bacterium]